MSDGKEEGIRKAFEHYYPMPTGVKWDDGVKQYMQISQDPVYIGNAVSYDSSWDDFSIGAESRQPEIDELRTILEDYKNMFHPLRECHPGCRAYEFSMVEVERYKALRKRADEWIAPIENNKS